MRKKGRRRSLRLDTDGIPLAYITALANRHDSPLLCETLDTVKTSGSLPEPANVHLDRGYDSDLTRKRLEERDLIGVISEKGKPAPLQATKRWVVERTNSSWNNAHKKLVWCTERRGAVIDFWGAFSNAINHRGPAHPKSLDSLPVGEPPFSQTVTLARPLSCKREHTVSETPIQHYAYPAL